MDTDIMFEFDAKIGGIPATVRVITADPDDGFEYELFDTDGNKDEELHSMMDSEDEYKFVWLPYLAAVGGYNDEIRIFQNSD